MDFKNANELLTLCEEQNISISEVMRNREIITGECPAKEVDQKMARVLEIMKEAARSPIEKPIRSMGGLIGGEAQKLAQHCFSLFRKYTISPTKRFSRFSSMRALSVTSPCEMPLLPVLSEGVRLRSVLHLLWQRLPLLNLWVELLSNVWMPPQQSL